VLRILLPESGDSGVFNASKDSWEGGPLRQCRKMNPSTESPRPLCVICGKPCSLEECITDAKGRTVHKECYRTLLLKAVNINRERS
jgi:hypothetical protein